MNSKLSSKQILYTLYNNISYRTNYVELPYIKGFLRIRRTGHIPRGHIPRGHIPRGHIPRGHIPRGHKPRGHIPRGHITRGHIPRGHIPRGHIPRGHKPRGHIPRGHITRGHIPRGHIPRGHIPLGHIPRSGLYTYHALTCFRHIFQYKTRVCSLIFSTTPQIHIHERVRSEEDLRPRSSLNLVIIPAVCPFYISKREPAITERRCYTDFDLKIEKIN